MGPGQEMLFSKAVFSWFAEILEGILPPPHSSYTSVFSQYEGHVLLSGK